MIYILLTITVFFIDFAVKSHMDKTYARGVPHPRLGRKILLEKYYNSGAALNLLAKKPKLMRAIHTIILLLAGIFYLCLLRSPGKALEKVGTSLVLGGGFSNLYDRYSKGHVIDYFRINCGPKWLRRIIFNLSDFCIFIGVLIAAAGADTSCCKGGPCA